MNDLTDQQLLRDYPGGRSEAAFAELVRRYIDLVYSASFRMVCHAQLAEDVTQGVFVALAQNARELTDHPVLSGWLHCAARNLAAKAVRADIRRRTREQEAAATRVFVATVPVDPRGSFNRLLALTQSVLRHDRQWPGGRRAAVAGR